MEGRDAQARTQFDKGGARQQAKAAPADAGDFGQGAERGIDGALALRCGGLFIARDSGLNPGQ